MKNNLVKIAFLFISINLIFSCSTDKENISPEKIKKEPKAKVQKDKSTGNFEEYQIYYMNESDDLIQVNQEEYINFLENERGLAAEASLISLNIVTGDDIGIKTITELGGIYTKTFHSITFLNNAGATAYRLMGETCTCTSECSSSTDCNASLEGGCHCSPCVFSCTKSSTASSEVFSSVSFL